MDDLKCAAIQGIISEMSKRLKELEKTKGSMRAPEIYRMSKIQTRLAESRPFHVRMFELLKKVLRFADE